jgi:hypothetical protein
MIADNFESLTDFCMRSSWSEVVRKHNDPAIDYHVSLYEYVVIGYELIAARDVMRNSDKYIFCVDAFKRTVRHHCWMEFSALCRRQR